MVSRLSSVVTAQPSDEEARTYRGAGWIGPGPIDHDRVAATPGDLVDAAWGRTDVVQVLEGRTGVPTGGAPTLPAPRQR